MIEVCACNLRLEYERTPPVHICGACKRPIGSRREGSLTQYIFGAGQCHCEFPQVDLRGSKRFNLSGTSELFEPHVEEVELDLDPEYFPLDRYKPLAELGDGAFGKVYLCLDRFLKKKVAIKTLHTLAADQLVSFQEEARATSHLSHPNIVTIYDFGATTGGVPFMVMEYVSGISLADLLQEKTVLPSQMVVEIAIQLCLALAYAHEHKVFHRDIKPSNILLSEEIDGDLRVRLIDFGVARVRDVTQLTTPYRNVELVGTPRYMSVDTVRGFEFDVRSEIYSLGCVLFETLEGHAPFTGDSPLSIVHSHIGSPVPHLENGEAPLELKVLIEGMLSKSPSDRPQSMDDMLSLLDEVLVFEESAESQEVSAEGLTRKRAMSLIMVLVVAVVISIGSVVTMSERGRTAANVQAPPPQSSEAKSEPVSDNLSTQLFMTDGGGITQQVSDGKNKINFPGGDVSASDLQLLESAPRVSRVDLAGCNLIDGGVVALSRLTRLKGISLKGARVDGAQFDNDDLKTISNLVNLEDLKLDSTDVTDEGVHYLLNFPELENLSLRDTDVSDKAMSVIAKMKHLKWLDLCAASGITADGLQALSGSNVRRISLYGLSIRPRELGALKKLPLDMISVGQMPGLITAWTILDARTVADLSPEKLNIQYVRFAPGALCEFARAKSLETLSLSYCEYDEGELVALQKALPNLNIRQKKYSGLEEMLIPK
ncbi:MAG: protein kinase [Cyanobacteria bacterium]|nr:protein kinase [Cyanobacteriota bacterium]